MAFGKEIKRIKENEKISAQKLAGIIGVDADRLRKWMEKDFDPRDEDLRTIESNFRMPLEDIMKLERLPKFLIVPHGTNEYHLLEDPPAKYYTKKEVENDILKEQVRELEAKLAECNQEIGSLKKDLEIERSKNFTPLKKTGKAGAV